MNNDIQIFNHEKLGEVRAVLDNSDIWFVATDITSALGLTNTTVALQGLEDFERTKLNLGRQGDTNMISESGMYALVMRSRKPEAKQFRLWVTSEVLPTIRKHGAYMTDNTLDKIVDNPDLLIKLATNLKEERELRIEKETQLAVAKEEQKVLEETIEIQAPKVEMWERLMNEGKSTNMGDVAKIFNIKGLGRNNFYELLREKDIVFKKNTSPMQRYVDAGYFEVKSVVHGFTSQITLVTPKGLGWLHGKLKEWGYIDNDNMGNVGLAN